MADEPSHHRLRSSGGTATTPPPGKRTPFGWPTRSLTTEAPLSLTPRSPTPTEPALTEPAPLDSAPTGPTAVSDESGHDWYAIRITTALDVREERRIEVRLGDGSSAGTIDLRYAYVLQPYEVELSRTQFETALATGVELCLVSGEGPHVIFTAGESASGDPVPPMFQPHVVSASTTGDRRQQFLNQVNSLSSLQPFGWLEGCVTEALWEFGEQDMLRTHLDLFLQEGTLLIETARSEISDGRFYSHEATLPVAALARLEPDHPVVQQAVDFWWSNPHGMTTEGCYTLAHPMAVVAAQRGDDDLAELAVRILRERHAHLREPWGVWQRQYQYRNWARACTWYALGMVRTLATLEHHDLAMAHHQWLREELASMGEVLLAHQRGDGLWNTYIDDAATGPDTSGSAGIATALAAGARHGYFPAQTAHAAQRTLAALEGHLTPDGLLGGSAQNNRGGEALQRSNYRVLSQMAMGLMGQLVAECERA